MARAAPKKQTKPAALSPSPDSKSSKSAWILRLERTNIEGEEEKTTGGKKRRSEAATEDTAEAKIDAVTDAFLAYTKKYTPDDKDYDNVPTRASELTKSIVAIAVRDKCYIHAIGALAEAWQATMPWNEENMSGQGDETEVDETIRAGCGEICEAGDIDDNSDVWFEPGGPTRRGNVDLEE